MGAAPVHEERGAPEGRRGIACALVVREGPEVIGTTRGVPEGECRRDVLEKFLVPSHSAHRREVGGLVLVALVAEPMYRRGTIEL